MKPPGWPAVLCSIDWSAPWFAPHAPVGSTVAGRCRDGLPLWEALALPGASPVDFVPQRKLPPGAAYESFVFAQRACPTREGPHDFFNGLCWHGFPATKARLNALQAGAIARDGIAPSRGALRDACTLIDESAAFLAAPDAVWDALAARRWQQLFVDQRALWRACRLWVFGHALLEKLLHPRKALTARVHRLPAGTRTLAEADQSAADLLAGDGLAAWPHAQLPLLGVPGWWPPNEAPGFYADDTVFRPPPPPASASASRGAQ